MPNYTCYRVSVICCSAVNILDMQLTPSDILFLPIARSASTYPFLSVNNACEGCQQSLVNKLSRFQFKKGVEISFSNPDFAV